MLKNRSLIVICLVFISLCILPFYAQAIEKVTYVSETAPIFSLKDLNNKEIGLKNFLGKKVILISFWTVYCSFCIKEFPELKTLHQEFSKKGLKILSINIMDSKKRVAKLIREKEINYSVLLDSNGRAAKLYGVRGVPFNVVIDKKGIVRYQWYGLPKDLKKIVESLILEKN